MKNGWIFYLGALFVVASCSTQKNLDKYDGQLIVFGHGGGYSGQEFQYTMNTQGVITLEDNFTRRPEVAARLDKKKTLAFYEELDDIMRPGIDFNHPGLDYFFIRQVTRDKTYNIVWGARDPVVPERFSNYYRTLMEVVERAGN